MLDSTQLQTLWFFSLASRSKLLTPLSTTLTLAFIFFLLSFLLINVIFWAHPGGPSWGKHKWTKNMSSKNKPIPGPKGFPIIGSMSLMSGLAHRKIAAKAEACGAKRLMAFSLGDTRAIVTCKAHVAKEILTSSNFADRPAKESAYRLMFNRSIGFAPYGAHWMALRKIAAHHLFCPKQVKESENQRKVIANQIITSVMGNYKQSGGGQIRVRDVLKRASLNNMVLSIFGRHLGDTDDELTYLVDQGYDLLGEVNWSDHLPFLSQWDLQKIRARCDRLVPRVNRLIGGIIADHKIGTGLNRDFVDVLLSLEGADSLSDSDMIAVLWEMIFRGTDTVAVLIEWILARLVLHPDVQSKVHAELDNVVGGSPVTESDLPRLMYLSAVVNEVLRMHPPGPLLSWSRLSIRDSTIDGCHVPGGTTAIVNMWAIMRDPEVWSDPLNFNPERFVGKDNDISVLGSDLRLAPFGAGRRSCPGKMLGLTTVNFWLATILHEFELSSYGSSVDLTETLKLSCEMANPLMVNVRPRHGISGSKS